MVLFRSPHSKLECLVSLLKLLALAFEILRHILRLIFLLLEFLVGFIGRFSLSGVAFVTLALAMVTVLVVRFVVEGALVVSLSLNSRFSARECRARDVRTDRVLLLLILRNGGRCASSMRSLTSAMHDCSSV